MSAERQTSDSTSAHEESVGPVNPLIGHQWASLRQLPAPPTIVDGYTDLLALLDPRRRRGMVAWLAVRYYDGYCPGRAEIADLIAVELGTLTFAESLVRQRARDRGDDRITDITPHIRERYRRYHEPHPAAHTNSSRDKAQRRAAQ
jgi:hypothetical protein